MIETRLLGDKPDEDMAKDGIVELLLYIKRIHRIE